MAVSDNAKRRNRGRSAAISVRIDSVDGSIARKDNELALKIFHASRAGTILNSGDLQVRRG